MSPKKIIVFVSIILILVIGGFFYSQSSKKATVETPQIDVVQKQKVEKVARDIVLSYLKSPGSAQFVSIFIGDSAKADLPESQKYIVFGDVDSQNSFGALLRSHFHLEFIYKGGDMADVSNWTINDFDLGNTNFISGGEVRETPLELPESTLAITKQGEEAIKDLSDIKRLIDLEQRGLATKEDKQRLDELTQKYK